MPVQPCADLEELSGLSSLFDFSRNPYITALSDSSWFNHLQTLLGTTVHSSSEIDEAMTSLLATIEGLEIAHWGLEGCSEGRPFEPHMLLTNEDTEPPVVVAYSHVRALAKEGNQVDIFGHRGEEGRRRNTMELCLQRIKGALGELGALSFALGMLKDHVVQQRDEEKGRKNIQEQWIEEQRQITKQRQEFIVRQKSAAISSGHKAPAPSIGTTDHTHLHPAPSESSSDNTKSGGISLGLALPDVMIVHHSSPASSRQRRCDPSTSTASKINPARKSYFGDTDKLDDKDWDLYHDATDAFMRLVPYFDGKSNVDGGLLGRRLPEDLQKASVAWDELHKTLVAAYRDSTPPEWERKNKGKPVVSPGGTEERDLAGQAAVEAVTEPEDSATKEQEDQDQGGGRESEMGYQCDDCDEIERRTSLE